MTLNTNARIAGFTLLFYIVAGLSALAVPREASVAAVLPLLTSFSALVLGVTLYAITRQQDADLAMLAMVCRIIEGIPRVSGEIYFAVGSLLFSWLLLRGRMIPVALAWLGVIASALLVVLIPSQLAGFLGGASEWDSRVKWALWLPMAVFEIVLALWLIIKGVGRSHAVEQDQRISHAC
jgi:hypothetical protein